MPLRIGVLAGKDAQTAGGTWTLPTALTTALKNTQSHHEFLFLDEILERNTPLREQARLSGEIILRSLYKGSVRIARRILPHEIDRHFLAKVQSQGRDSYLEQLEAAINQQRLDVVWFMKPPGVPLSIPFIATVWDLEHRKRPYFPEVSVTGWTWTDRDCGYSTALPRASFVLTGTQAGKEEVVHYYRVNPENVKVIPLPVPREDSKPACLNMESIRERYAIKGNFLFYPAQFWPHKNHVNLLMALDILRKRNGLRLNLILTGSDKGNRGFVAEKVRELDLSEQVFDLGFVSREELNTLYMNALALVFPSFFGPDNLPALEAFVFGCPVITANVPGAEEQLGKAALFFDPSDPTDIAAKILALRENPQCRHRLINEGSKIAHERTADNYIAAICELLDSFESVRRCWGSNYKQLF
jgi:glycosyltransferase involved in cell wall biosynthesis